MHVAWPVYPSANVTMLVEAPPVKTFPSIVTCGGVGGGSVGQKEGVVFAVKVKLFEYHN